MRRHRKTERQLESNSTSGGNTSRSWRGESEQPLKEKKKVLAKEKSHSGKANTRKVGFPSAKRRPTIPTSSGQGNSPRFIRGVWEKFQIDVENAYADQLKTRASLSKTVGGIRTKKREKTEKQAGDKDNRKLADYPQTAYVELNIERGITTVQPKLRGRARRQGESPKRGARKPAEQELTVTNGRDKNARARGPVRNNGGDRRAQLYESGGRSLADITSLG